MKEKQLRDWRFSILLIVLLMHMTAILVVMQSGKQRARPRTSATDAAMLLYLPETKRVPQVPSTQSPKRSSSRISSPNLSLSRVDDNDLAAQPATPAPKIDWENEAAIAVRQTLAKTVEANGYRDLSASLSPSQLDWLKRNHMAPEAPGITWRRPRVEVMPDGMPIIHINDRCVLVPLLLMPMVFCSVGHVEPKGDLFKNMRDMPAH